MLDRMLLSAGGEEKLYVEDVFSTYLVSSTTLGVSETINNGVNLSGKGGLVWMKARNGSGGSNVLVDTARGASNCLFSDGTGGQANVPTIVPGFTSSGFQTGSWINSGGDATNFASWTFREAPKFFDVVTYTGNGTAGRQIAHNLGVTPGFIIVKRTDSTSDWTVWHRSATGNAFLQTTDAWQPSYTRITTPDTTSFTVSESIMVNASGGTYVAYLFAHDATADGIIQCGSFSASGAGQEINLGWEPQWLLVKNASSTSGWYLWDTMRGFSQSNDATLQPNTSGAEVIEEAVAPTATGFIQNCFPAGWGTVAYIAIRRGPMKTPTVGTSVFYPNAYTGNGTSQTFTVGFPPDMAISMGRRNNTNARALADKMRGTTQYLYSTNTLAEATSTAGSDFSAFGNVTYSVGAPNQTYINTLGAPLVDYIFRRAPGFFDVVCSTGNGAENQRISHSLGVAPELIITKCRNQASEWPTYQKDLGIGAFLRVNGTYARYNAANSWGTQAPTATDFGISGIIFNSGQTFVAYLFASCPGVSKVGSYTGNGSSQTINCGFSNGARFFLVKRTDSTGDWWVYDSARGIVAAADPALRLNSTAAEVTSADAVDTNSTGIIVNQETTCNINVNGATYIYLAIA